MRGAFAPRILPADYLSFLRIHDGFARAQDTGLISVAKLVEIYEGFLAFLAALDPLLLANGRGIEPKNLIPFYVSFGRRCYQCFDAEWYPEEEMGNVYYSDVDHTLSEVGARATWEEHLAFPTFLDWLLFYLKGVDEV